MKRVLKINDSLNVCKYQLIEEYDGYAIYQRYVGGIPVHEDYALMDLGLDDSQMPIVILSFNNISKLEILDAIDQRNMDGDFGWRAFFRDDGTARIVVHPNGSARI